MIKGYTKITKDFSVLYTLGWDIAPFVYLNLFC